MVSIIIRTKNEERWITPCLNAVFSQGFKDFEVILVDNESEDKTVEKAQQYNIKLFSIKDYLPGLAINTGIQQSKGDIIVILSGHCIPTTTEWLSNLIRNLNDPIVAGVYGRQEPMFFSSDSDKRDLMTIFGMDKKRQIKDSFFHNANSAIKRKIWEEIPFDNETTNIEDRIWGQQVISKGYHIIYEPEASVYHYHGIYQDNDIKRCRNVVTILESLEKQNNKTRSNDSYFELDITKLNVISLIPVKGEMDYCNDKPLIEYTLKHAFDSKYIKNTIVLTDNVDIASFAKNAGADVPFLRSPELSKEYVGIQQVLKDSLEQLEKMGYLPDIVVVMEVTYPFRPKGFVDKIIEQFVREGTDCLISGKPERRSAWINDGKSVEVVSSLMPRHLKEKLLFISLFGLGFVTYPKHIREGDLMDNNIGIYTVVNPYSCIEVRDEASLIFAEPLLKKFWQDNHNQA